jgi:hypothetical protein
VRKQKDRQVEGQDPAVFSGAIPAALKVTAELVV